MYKFLTTILIILTFCHICIAQEIDSLLYNDMDFGKDSLYNLQLELKASQGKLSDCDFAIQNATSDFKKNIYTLHSSSFSGHCSYCAVLKQDYNIDWELTIDLFSDMYYKCYDSTMSKELIEKYEYHIFEIAKLKADSLEQTENWISNAEFIGGQQKLMKFIMTRLTIDSTDMKDGIKTKIYIELEIDSTGKTVNPIIREGIGERTDKNVIEIINEMPKWKPAYLYGQPIRQKYYMPINIDY